MVVDYSKYTGQPCPFLGVSECTIYEHRPIACRLHFSLADTAFFCDSARVKSEYSAVPNLDTYGFDTALVALVMSQNNTYFGDIRDFFGPV